MAGKDSVTAREAAEGVLALEHADVLRESVALMVREIMEAEVAHLVGAEFGERAGAPQRAARWVSPAALGHAGGRDRAGDPAVAHGQLSAVVSGAAPARRAGVGRGRPGGLRQRRLDAQGRSARRADGPAPAYRRLLGQVHPAIVRDDDHPTAVPPNQLRCNPQSYAPLRVVSRGDVLRIARRIAEQSSVTRSRYSGLSLSTARIPLPVDSSSVWWSSIAAKRPPRM